MNNNLVSFRRELHKHPELSGKEFVTQKRIKQFLLDHGIENVQEVGETGLLCSYEFGAGPSLLIRVDCDALPIQEVNQFEYKSMNEGISHKCGHDGHTTIGAGLAIRLKESPLKSGSVHLVFQPSEENGEGARKVVSDPIFQKLKLDYAVALHNIPGAKTHQIIWKKDSFTPAVQSLIIRLKGKTSHAAEPLKGHNPAYAIAEIILWARGHEVTDESHPDFHLITPIYSTLGSQDYGISAGYGEIHFTIRSWEQQRMEWATQEVLSTVESIRQKHHLEAETEIIAVFESNKNDHHVVDAIVNSAKNLGLESQERPVPFPWGEDFGLFTQQMPGAMFGLGAGLDTPALHNPDYDFPDEIIETGISVFYETAKRICSAHV